MRRTIFNILPLVLLYSLLLLPIKVNSQPLRGTTGLLHAPTAEMQADKTFMFGGNVLDITPLHYYKMDVKYTFNYFINFTFFPWFELGYTCTINYANQGSAYFPKQSWGKYTNQDRSFNARFRLWKEGWWKPWTPQIVLGFDDPGTHEYYGGGNINFNGGGNAWFTRYYLAATKHFDFTNIGTLGAHLSFIANRPSNWKAFNRPAAGTNFRFTLPEVSTLYKAINGLDLMAEYDAQTVNVGAQYHILKDNINLVAELNDGKYFSGGIFFRIQLK